MPGFCICKRCLRFWIMPMEGFWVPGQPYWVLNKPPALNMDLWNWVTSINISSKTQEKEALPRSVLEIFLLDTLKTKLWMENLTQRWTQSGLFFQIQDTFFHFLKRQGKPPLYPQLGASECGWIYINIPKYVLISMKMVK